MKAKWVLYALIVLLIPVATFAENISIKVEGMVCMSCVNHIKKVFGENQQIKTTEVDLKSKMVTLTTSEDAEISDDTLKQIIKDAGYEAVEIKRE